MSASLRYLAGEFTTMYIHPTRVTKVGVHKGDAAVGAVEAGAAEDIAQGDGWQEEGQAAPQH